MFVRQNNARGRHVYGAHFARYLVRMCESLGPLSQIPRGILISLSKKIIFARLNGKEQSQFGGPRCLPHASHPRVCFAPKCRICIS